MGEAQQVRFVGLYHCSFRILLFHPFLGFPSGFFFVIIKTPNSGECMKGAHTGAEGCIRGYLLGTCAQAQEEG